MLNVSSIFTAVLVAAVRNCSACHVLLSQDKSSSTLHLGSETSRDKRSWVSVLDSTYVLYKSCQVFLHLHSRVKETPPVLCFWETQAEPSLGATGMWLLRAWRGIPFEQPWLLWLCLTKPRSFGVSGYRGTSTPSDPAPVCCCQLSQTPNVQHRHLAASPLCQHPRSLILALLVTCYHTSAISVLNTASHSKSWEIALRDLPVASRNSLALWLLIKQLGEKMELIILSCTVTHLEVRKFFELLCATAATSLRGSVLLSCCPGGVCFCAGSMWQGFGSRGLQEWFL